MEEIKAKLVQVIQTSTFGNNWKVCTMRPVERWAFDNDFTAVGDIPEVGFDDVVDLQGDWDVYENKKSGKKSKQFRVTSVAIQIPTTPHGLERYIAAHVKGVGPVLASDMTIFFGGELRHVLDNNPSRFREMGLATELIARIDAAWNEDKHLRPISLFLEGYDISGKTWAKPIYKEFGPGAPAILLENPYRLTRVSRIGFNKAHEFAKKFGWPETSPQCTEAALLECLNLAKDEGHVFLTREQMLKRGGELAAGENWSRNEIPIARPLVEAALQAVVERGEVIEDTVSGNGELDDVSMYYDTSLHFMETALADRIVTLVAVPPRPSKRVIQLIAQAERVLNITLSDKQQKAVIAAMLNSFSIITGGPGVGKTVITKVILFCMQKLGWSVSIAAPTGRAAKRISEVTHHPASTVHRLLKYEHGNWTHNRQTPLDCNALFLDEWSMGDTELTYRVMEAVPEGCHVVLIGDIDQLPSVGPGMILRDLIDCGCVTVTRLDTIFRQAEGSLIVQNAHRIIRGEYPEFPAKGVLDADNYVMYVPQIWSEEKKKKVDDVQWIYDNLNFLLTDYLADRYGIDPLVDVQVMTPMKKGTCGTEQLNIVLHKILNNDGIPFHVEGKLYHIGDRMMQLKNNYEQKVFNGDQGVILGNDVENEAVRIAFDSETILYPYAKMREMQLAFASTVHKLQGSELPVAIVCLLGQHYTMLERNLVYTALTRAKRMCLFITTHRALATAIKKCNIQKRNSYLGERVRKAIAQPQFPVSIIPTTLQLSA